MARKKRPECKRLLILNALAFRGIRRAASRIYSSAEEKRDISARLKEEGIRLHQERNSERRGVRGRVISASEMKLDISDYQLEYKVGEVKRWQAIGK